jgi:hypothetical protein
MRSVLRGFDAIKWVNSGQGGSLHLSPTGISYDGGLPYMQSESCVEDIDLRGAVLTLWTGPRRWRRQ